jgi:hypothetical protein
MYEWCPEYRLAANSLPPRLRSPSLDGGELGKKINISKFR